MRREGRGEGGFAPAGACEVGATFGVSQSLKVKRLIRIESKTGRKERQSTAGGASERSETRKEFRRSSS